MPYRASKLTETERAFYLAARLAGDVRAARRGRLLSRLTRRQARRALLGRSRWL